MRIFSIFILSISMVFIEQGIRTDAADIVTLNLSPSAGKPLFPSSVVSNDIDFIKSTDASVAYCIAFQKTGRAKMVDKRHNRLLTLNVSFFVVRFADGTRVGLWVHPDLGPRAVILHYARHVARGLSHLPSAMRETLSHVVIHHGDETAFAEDEEHFLCFIIKILICACSNMTLKKPSFTKVSMQHLMTGGHVIRHGSLHRPQMAPLLPTMPKPIPTVRTWQRRRCFPTSC